MNVTKNLHGLTVVSFESRHAEPMRQLIEQAGAKALVAPSMKEVPVGDNRAAFDFFDDLKRGKFDLTILMTGVATKTLLSSLEVRYPLSEIITELSIKTKIVVRGPKPTAVCRSHNIPIACTAPEPNTWREILSILSQEKMLERRSVAVIEYGISNPAFLEELKDQGATVTPVRVYTWAMPDDLGPLHSAIDTILKGQVDLALFTTAVQVDHLLQGASMRGVEGALRRQLTRVGICSIGPATSEKLSDRQLFPDLESSPNKMAALVRMAAEKGRSIVERRRLWAARAWVRDENTNFKIDVDSLVLRACRREKNKSVPIWLMRQAGRYLAEYQLVRNRVSFSELCKDPNLATEVTLSAVERLSLDAAIIFSDILLIVEPMGLPLTYLEGSGPLIASPVRDIEAIKKLRPVDVPTDLGFVMEAIRTTRRSLNPRIPLIGFAGAPFTLASYMIEGRGSKNFVPTKTLMHSAPKAFHTLLEKITSATINYLNAQIDAGCQLVQVFDSWVRTLTADEYRRFVLPHSRLLFQGIKKGTPVIHFGTFSLDSLDLQKEGGGDVLSLGWSVNIKEAWDRLGPDVGIQGNLDPALLFSKPNVFLKEAERILREVGSRPGFIFNLGHGILPETPVDHVLALVDYVHSWVPTS